MNDIAKNVIAIFSPTREHFRVAQQRQVIPVLFFHQGDRRSQYLRLETNIRIRKHQPLTGGMFVSLLQPVRFAQPTGGKGTDADHFQAANFARRRV